MYQLDSIDVKILRALQTDGRIPLTKLSKSLDIPHGTIRDRIRKMEHAGLIEGYSATINPVKMGFLISCFVEIVLDHQVEANRAIETLMNMEEVTEVYILTGETDALVRIWARDIEHLREILYDKFIAIPGLLRTNTLVVLNTRSKPIEIASP